MGKLIMAAFGGNALLRGDQKGYYDEQIQNATDTCENLIPIIERGHNLVITHGNGPQVGNVLLQNEAGESKYDIPALPMHVCVAETQGHIGYLIEQAFKNVLLKHGIEKNIISVVTQVIVDKNDPAFANPTKPVGPYYSEEEANILQHKFNWSFKADPRGRGFRRVVPSPKPIEILNWPIIEQLSRAGNIVIAAGGGGIPVIKNDEGSLMGVDAVIDKDLAAATLAVKINADEFFILTDISNAYLNFNKPNQVKLNKVSANEMKKYLEEGHFADGSMGPKIKAGLYFIDNGGNDVIITDANNLKNPDAGTVILKD